MSGEMRLAASRALRRRALRPISMVGLLAGGYDRHGRACSWRKMRGQEPSSAVLGRVLPENNPDQKRTCAL